MWRREWFVVEDSKRAGWVENITFVCITPVEMVSWKETEKTTKKLR
jgi:hypothetical protein